MLSFWPSVMTVQRFLRFTNRSPRPMRKAINTQIVSRLNDSLIIIGLQRYDFFFIPQAFFTLFLFCKS